MTPIAPPSRRIVLTGGPGAGKTVISRMIVDRHPDRLVLVPEAATRVYDLLQTRWDRLDVVERRRIQRQIYQHQLEQEDRASAENPGKVLILDRGTIDGGAYWPEGPEAWWRDAGSTAEAQLARYDAVVWLQTAAALGIYDGDTSNPRRFEEPEAAIRSGEMLSELWGAHPRIYRINAHPTLDAKAAAVERVIHGLIVGWEESRPIWRSPPDR